MQSRRTPLPLDPIYRAVLAPSIMQIQGKGVLGTTHHLGRQCLGETPDTLFLAGAARSPFLQRLCLNTPHMLKEAPLKPYRWHLTREIYLTEQSLRLDIRWIRKRKALGFWMT